MRSLDGPKPTIFGTLVLGDICDRYVFIPIENIKVLFTISEFSTAVEFWFLASSHFK